MKGYVYWYFALGSAGNLNGRLVAVVHSRAIVVGERVVRGHSVIATSGTTNILKLLKVLPSLSRCSTRVSKVPHQTVQSVLARELRPREEQSQRGEAFQQL